MPAPFMNGQQASAEHCVVTEGGKPVWDGASAAPLPAGITVEKPAAVWSWSSRAAALEFESRIARLNDDALVESGTGDLASSLTVARARLHRLVSPGRRSAATFRKRIAGRGAGHGEQQPRLGGIQVRLLQTARPLFCSVLDRYGTDPGLCPFWIPGEDGENSETMAEK